MPMNSVWRFILIVFVLIFAGGCGNDAEPETAEQAPQEVQTLSEKQMVLLFQILVQMDKKEGLSISKAQANKMLPIIRKNSSQGEMTNKDLNMILEMLNPPQKLYYDDVQEQFNKRIQAVNENKTEADEMTDEEREQLIRNFKQRRSEKESKPIDMSAGTSVMPEDEPAGCNKNVEQQLIELLEIKQK